MFAICLSKSRSLLPGAPGGPAQGDGDGDGGNEEEENQRGRHLHPDSLPGDVAIDQNTAFKVITQL